MTYTFNFFPGYEYINHVQHNKLLATLPIWDKFYRVSFDLWVGSFAGSVNSWSDVLLFESTGHNCCNAGDRVPGIFLNSDGYLTISAQVGTNGNYYKNVNIRPYTWIKVEIQQFPEHGKVFSPFKYLDKPGMIKI